MSWNNDNSPWGNGNNQGSWGGSGGSKPQDLEEFIRKSQDRIRRMMPKNFGNKTGFLGIIFIFILIWMATGLYRVQEGEQGVEIRFGKYVNTTQPGLRYHFPYPIETAITKKITEVNRIDIGINSTSGTLRHADEPVFMLTGDANMLDVNMTIFWFIKDVGSYLFRAVDPENTVKVAAESAVREVIAQTPMELALTKGKSYIAQRVQDDLQRIVDDYEIGIQIQKVDLQKVEAPEPVIEAFRDVENARQDQERMINESLGYHDSIVPVAKGEAEQIIQEAIGERQATISRSSGESQRFLLVWKQYKTAPSVTKKRIYLETIEKIMKNANIVLLDKEINGVLPFLPIPGVKAETQPQKGQAQ
jgi:membrane protease subunit HflK